MDSASEAATRGDSAEGVEGAAAGATWSPRSERWWPGGRLGGGPAASLVPNGDVAASATALGTLMDDAAARADAGRRAREYGRRFSAPAIVDRWLELWDQLAGRLEPR